MAQSSAWSPGSYIPGDAPLCRFWKSAGWLTRLLVRRLAASEARNRRSPISRTMGLGAACGRIAKSVSQASTTISSSEYPSACIARTISARATAVLRETPAQQWTRRGSVPRLSANTKTSSKCSFRGAWTNSFSSSPSVPTISRQIIEWILRNPAGLGTGRNGSRIEITFQKPGSRLAKAGRSTWAQTLRWRWRELINIGATRRV